jgi:hypothetical protein
VFVLELREFSSAIKEVVVCCLQVFDGLLQGLAIDFGEPFQCLLEFGQVFAVLEVAVAFPVV